MSHLTEEIATQPACWRRAAALIGSAPRASGLPVAGERVAVLGCGTSYYVGQAYAALRERAGLGETDAFPASEFPAARRYDRVLALSRSGTTTEVLTALGRVAPGTPTVAITADPATPVGGAAGAVLTLDFADERSVVQTRFATTALALLRAHLGADVGVLAEQAEAALAEPLPAVLTGAEQWSFLGTGWTVGLANEAALKLREAAQAWTESYVAMEYRHGPISIAAPGRVVWIFGDAPDGLVGQIRGTGAHVETWAGDPLADLVRAHRLADALATVRGLDPDRPRHLDRSVVLT
ncbi:MAG: SIS domain-containing protein [Labedaea sp.]